ncbi:MAG: class I SAM-dependent methyltransferase [Thermoplasmatota archaeon]
MSRPPPDPALLPPGPFGRVLWLSSAPIPKGWAKTWRTAGDAEAAFDAIVLDDLALELPDRRPAALQRRLAPGGLLAVLAPRRPRATARLLRPYFEGGAPRGKERFRPVRPEGRVVLAYRRGPTMALGHFDELAQDYVAEIPAHLVQHYLDRKLAVLRLAVGTGPARLGLDLGCGIGEYARAVATSMAAKVVAVDASQPAVAVARRRGLTPSAAVGGSVEFAAGDAQRLPFAGATFDFASTINMVHHLKRGEQEAALAEALRVLRPGAPLVVFEINVLNPLFRFYMRHVFPRTRRIDRGDEEFLTPRAFRRMAPGRVERIAYSTFVPDFTPRWLLPALRPVERGLERVAGPLGIHYAAVLRGGGPQQADDGADERAVA